MIARFEYAGSKRDHVREARNVSFLTSAATSPVGSKAPEAIGVGRWSITTVLQKMG